MRRGAVTYWAREVVMYDHIDEVHMLRARANKLRCDAQKLLEQAREIEREANHIDKIADSVHRLCADGSNPPATCCKKA